MTSKPITPLSVTSGDAPIACSLSGSDQADRIVRWRALLATGTLEHEPTRARLVTTADRLGEIVELAAAEQECCPFLDFDIALRRDQVHLTVTCAEDGRPMLDALLSIEADA